MMPSHSKKQHNFMEAVANNPKFAKKVGVPKSVGKDFEKADKGMKFRSGGRVKRYEAGGSTYGGGAEGYIETPTSRSYSAEEITEALKKGADKLKGLFSFRRPESEPSAPIETRKGSPKPSIKANVSDEDPLGSARQKLGNNDPSGIVKLPQSSGSSSGSSSISSSTAGPKPPPPPSVQEEMARREKGGDNSGDDYGNGEGSSGFTSSGNAKKAAEYRQSLIGSATGSSSNTSRPNSGTSGSSASTSASSSNTSRPASSASGSSSVPVKRPVKQGVNKEPVNQGRSAAAYQNYDVKEAGRSAERSQERDRFLKNYDPKKDAVEPDTTLEEAASYLLGGAGALKGAYGLGRAALGKLFGSKAGSSLKSQAINEINAARATAGDARGPVSGAIQPKGTGPSKEARRMMGEDIAPATIKPTGQGPSQAGKDLMERSGTRQNKVAPEAESAADKARRLVSERRAAEKKLDDEKAQAEIDKQLEEARRKTQARRKSNAKLELQGRRGSKTENLNAKPSGPDSKFAKGGKVKAFAKGGFVRKSADGCAQRGKTRGQIR